jgi:hypothetical protein
MLNVIIYLGVGATTLAIVMKFGIARDLAHLAVVRILV